MQTQLSHLAALEAESIHIFREVAAEFERPVLLFSGGKDSIVMLRLAEKAFAPARIPFPVMHVDTGHNFPEVLQFRDRRVAELGVQLVIASVPEALEAGLVRVAPDGMLYAVNGYLPPRSGETPFVERVRYRTVGDASCTAAVKSDADTIDKVIAEVAATRITERGATRGDDKFSEAAMEDRKREGYF